MIRSASSIGISFLLAFAAATTASAQSYTREMTLPVGASVEVINRSGRVHVIAQSGQDADRVVLSATAASGAAVEGDIAVETQGRKMRIDTGPAGTRKRIDLKIIVPERTQLRLQTTDGEIRVEGDLESVTAETVSGTIAADVPTADLRYDFQWLSARPRVVADFELENVKEKAGGRFGIKGRRQDGTTEANGEQPGHQGNGGEGQEPQKEKKNAKQQRVELDFTTERGIVVLNVPPNEVMSDLRERPLTDAAKAIVRSGDKVLMEAIRRASPKYFGDYERTLPPLEREPSISVRQRSAEEAAETVKQALVSVTDLNNRSVAGLEAGDFAVTESGEAREVISVKPVTAPVNLVLLLDVSGSVDNYVDFIRKAARSFVNTARPDDRISLLLFNEDVKELTTFTTDKNQLSESLDTFDAGGATAYYDAIAYTLAEVLRPFRGQRTAIVVLTDGDDNRSFLPFDSLAGAIEESGALIYPLYVPSALVAAASTNPEAAIDPVRSRYNGLTQKAQGEGEKLAKISGGVYYPISKLGDIQKAYDDIVVQLRTAYTVTFRSGLGPDAGNRPSPRLKVKVNRPNAYATVSRVYPQGQ